MAGRRRTASSTLDAPGVLAWLEQHGSKRTRDEQRTRYGITAARAHGVPVGTLQKLARRIGTNHDLAAALWETGWYEARLLAAWIDDPARVTAAQMDRWTRDFDNWGVCDTLCFALFDKSPLAWGRIAPWSRSRHEFTRRAAFALLACLALHDREAADGRFLRCLPLVERGAADPRHFVGKGVSWALRAIGRRNAALNAATVAVATRLSASDAAAPRAIGRLALRENTAPALQRKLRARAQASRV